MGETKETGRNTGREKKEIIISSTVQPDTTIRSGISSPKKRFPTLNVAVMPRVSARVAQAKLQKQTDDKVKDHISQMVRERNKRRKIVRECTPVVVRESDTETDEDIRPPILCCGCECDCCLFEETKDTFCCMGFCVFCILFVIAFIAIMLMFLPKHLMGNNT